MRRLWPCLLLVSCSQAGVDPSAVLEVVALDCPAPAGSQVPNLAVDSDGRAFLTWIEPDGRGHALRLSVRERGGWSAARTIASGQDWFVNWADFPMLAVLRDGSLAAHWLKKSAAGTFDYDVRVSRSRDGVAWSEPVTPHRDGKAAEHGFVSIVPAGPEAAILWLDGRDISTEGGAAKGNMKLMTAMVAPEGPPGPERVLDDRVCECCQTSAAEVSGGLVAVYRGRSADKVRDILVVTWRDGAWSSPRVLWPDGWTIPG